MLDLNAAASGHVLGYQHDVFQREFLDSELYHRFIKNKETPSDS